MQANPIEVAVPAGATVFREGERGDCAYVVEQGEVEIAIERRGAVIPLASRGPGEVFGEMAIIDDKPRTATATALAPTTLLVISREQLTNRLRQTDPVLRMCLSVVLQRFRDTIAAMRTARGVAPPTRGHIGPTGDGGEHAAALGAIRLERELSEALERGDLELRYQPIVALARGATDGFEALVRWRHPERGLVSPAAFIPTAEASGLIVPLGRWVLREACAALGRLDRQSPGLAGSAQTPFISVNVSVHDLYDAGFVDHLTGVLRATGVRPGRIKLEITESLLMQQPETAAETLARCRALGVGIALDDFGTGYSGLGYLHRFPIDTLKIDRSFIEPLAAAGAVSPIVRSIIGLARELGLTLVAEGIEQPRQADTLRRLGCGMGQGFLYARPLVEADAAQFLTRGLPTGAGSEPRRPARTRRQPFRQGLCRDA